MAKDVLDAVYGCLVGGAIGDALGAPVEGWDYTDIRKQFGKMDELVPSEHGNTYTAGRRERHPPGLDRDGGEGERRVLCRVGGERQGQLLHHGAALGRGPGDGAGGGSGTRRNAGSRVVG